MKDEEYIGLLHDLLVEERFKRLRSMVVEGAFTDEFLHEAAFDQIEAELKVDGMRRAGIKVTRPRSTELGILDRMKAYERFKKARETGKWPGS